jgi:hypothetical protein
MIMIMKKNPVETLTVKAGARLRIARDTSQIAIETNVATAGINPVTVRIFTKAKMAIKPPENLSWPISVQKSPTHSSARRQGVSRREYKVPTSGPTALLKGKNLMIVHLRTRSLAGKRSPQTKPEV